MKVSELKFFKKKNERKKLRKHQFFLFAKLVGKKLSRSWLSASHDRMRFGIRWIAQNLNRIEIKKKIFWKKKNERKNFFVFVPVAVHNDFSLSYFPSVRSAAPFQAADERMKTHCDRQLQTSSKQNL
jgi:hypothetical protein